MNTPIDIQASWPIADPPTGAVVARIFHSDGATAIVDTPLAAGVASEWRLTGNVDLPDSVDAPLQWEARFVVTGGAYAGAPLVRSLGTLGFVKGGRIVFPALLSDAELQQIATDAAPLIRAIVGTAAQNDPTPPIKDALKIVAGDSFDQAFQVSGLDISNWTKAEFIVKSDPASDADSEALIFIRVSNPPAGDDGLQVNRGRKSDSEEHAGGSLSVDSVSPDALLTLHAGADATDISPSGEDSPFTYGLIVYLPGGRKRTIGEGSLSVLAGIGG